MTPDDDAAVALLLEMLEVASPSGHEEALAKLLQERMDGLGFASYVDDVGNVVGDIGTGDGPTVMLLSHLDTVDRPLEARHDGDWVHGRGAVDAKGPLAAMICGAARRPDFPGTVRVIGAVEEELLSKGGHHVAATMEAPDILVIGEPSGASALVLGYRGKCDVGYRVDRPSTHSTNPEAKATELVVEFWQGLLDVLGPDRDHARFDAPAATLRGIGGDPVSAWADIDVRLPPGFDVDAFARALAGIAGDGELDVVRSIPAVKAKRSNPAARALSAAIRSQGKQPRPLLKTGTSDMNTVHPIWGDLPVVAYGPGDSSLDHGDEERLEVAEFLTGVAVIATMLDELA